MILRGKFKEEKQLIIVYVIIGQIISGRSLLSVYGMIIPYKFYYQRLMIYR